MNNINWRNATEIIAVTSIVLSLIFVGYELRENSAVARSNAFNVFIVSISENIQNLAGDPILAPLVVRVNHGAMPNDFDADEQFRITLHFDSLLRLWEGLYRSVQEGILGDEYLLVVGKGGAFNNPYFRSIWPTDIRAGYTLDFVEFFQGLDWNSER